jgi:tRNA-splicing ligase RtcB
VIPTRGAVIPAAVGVDIGCGMDAVLTSLRASDLPPDLGGVRHAIERAVPHGRTANGGPGDRGAWGEPPAAVERAWAQLGPRFEAILERHPGLRRGPAIEHLGTLGTGNHFIELCLDLEGRVWVMLHSGSRGVGNRIGQHFIELAKREVERWFVELPDPDLAYLPEGTPLFADYLEAAGWAQDYAAANRALMMEAVLEALRSEGRLPAFEAPLDEVRCHHNYVAWEHHYGENVLVTRKGAVRAREGDRGIIPGSMGARSYLVRGLGNRESFASCSHGAGRAMSRSAAVKAFTVEQHAAATEGIECRKDAGVLDETPLAYKPIDAVMQAQRDLVEVTHELRQVLCVKG